MTSSCICPKVPEGITRIICPANDEDLIFPAALLACGELVAFPTETVYGLGASATDAAAVAKIFKAKGRPSDNPLIVHVARKSDINELVLEITPLAECLMDAFMPGPITLVMKKSAKIPDLVSAGLQTVGIRMPSHPISQKLILLSGVAVAAPSANVSGSPSPTRAEHVEKDLGGRIPCIVDGGPCEVGLESTVVDVTGSWPAILRPGAVTAEMIIEACRRAGILIPEGAVLPTGHEKDHKTPRAPGMKYRHYSPRAFLSVVMPQKNINEDEYFVKITEILSFDGKSTVGIFCGKQESEYLKKVLPSASFSRLVFYVFGQNEDISGAAKGLFDGIRTLDNAGVKHILASGFSGEGLARAYMNRLEKAAADKKNPDLDQLEESSEPIRSNILFVCTGNTCRSPMAESIFNMLASRSGPFVKRGSPLIRAVLHSTSAGIFADSGSPAARNAADAVRILYDADLSGHQSRKTKESIIAQNDLVFAVTREHAQILRRMYPLYSDKIFSFSEYAQKKSVFLSRDGISAHISDVPDPFGQHAGLYLDTARYLYNIIEALWTSILTDLGLDSADSIK